MACTTGDAAARRYFDVRRKKSRGLRAELPPKQRPRMIVARRGRRQGATQSRAIAPPRVLDIRPRKLAADAPMMRDANDDEQSSLGRHALLA